MSDAVPQKMPLGELVNYVGQEMGVSSWTVLDQARIQEFAHCTGDHQWIHVDAERATRESPFGGTIAHGFLLISLLTHLYETSQRPPIAGMTMGINYGFDRVRFVHPVRAGSRIRGLFTLAAVEEKRPGQYQQQTDVSVEIAGVDKPALTAVWISQFLL